jgi:hypothetical protein
MSGSAILEGHYIRALALDHRWRESDSTYQTKALDLSKTEREIGNAQLRVLGLLK